MKKILTVIIICFGLIELYGCSKDPVFEYALPEYRIRNETGHKLTLDIVNTGETININDGVYGLLPLQNNPARTFHILFDDYLFEVYKGNTVYDGIKGKRDPRDGLNYNYVEPLIYEFVYTPEDYQRFLDSKEPE